MKTSFGSGQADGSGVHSIDPFFKALLRWPFVLHVTPRENLDPLDQAVTTLYL